MALGGPIQAIPHDARPVIKPVHASTPHTTTTTATKATPAPSWLTTAGLEATKQANDAVAPEVQGLQGQQENYDAQQKSYEAAMTGFYSALAPYMAQIQGHVSDAYNSAAKTMGDIGHGYAGVLGANADANTAEMNAALTRAGQTPVAGSTAPMTDAFAATHGGAEGSAFAQEGAAKAAAAAGTPAVWAAQGRDGLTEAIQKAVEGDAGWAQKISDVYAKVPALRQQILSTMQDLKIKQDTFDLNKAAKIEQLNQGRARLAQGDTRLGLQASMDEFNKKYKIGQQQISIATLNLNARKFAQSTLNANRAYAVSLATLGLKTRADQRAAISAEYKLANGGFTKVQVLKFTGNATALADDAFNGIVATDKLGQPIKDKGGHSVYLHPALTYQQAIRESRKSGIPLSIAKAELDKVYQPGVRGRPFDEASSPALQGPGLGNSNNPLVAYATRYLGVPYSWGGGSPSGPTKGFGRGAKTIGFDCSSFIQAVMVHAGVKNFPRTTFAQVKVGQPVNLNQLQPGDAVFTEPSKAGPNHVGLYIGNGMVQESPQTGDVNKIIPLKDFLSGGFVAARRYLP